jgi:hypothetical protein
MNIEQAKLLAKGANHVKNVGHMNSRGVFYNIPSEPVCFVCELYRAGLASEEELLPGGPHFGVPSMSEFFGITVDERRKITVGDYQNGPECYEAVKALLVKYGYGYLLDAPEELIPVRHPVYKDQFTPADAGFDWRKIGVTC